MPKSNHSSTATLERKLKNSEARIAQLQRVAKFHEEGKGLLRNRVKELELSMHAIFAASDRISAYRSNIRVSEQLIAEAEATRTRACGCGRALLQKGI